MIIIGWVGQDSDWRVRVSLWSKDSPQAMFDEAQTFLKRKNYPVSRVVATKSGANLTVEKDKLLKEMTKDLPKITGRKLENEE